VPLLHRGLAFAKHVLHWPLTHCERVRTNSAIVVRSAMTLQTCFFPVIASGCSDGNINPAVTGDSRSASVDVSGHRHSHRFLPAHLIEWNGCHSTPSQLRKAIDGVGFQYGQPSYMPTSIIGFCTP